MSSLSYRKKWLLHIKRWLLYYIKYYERGQQKDQIIQLEVQYSVFGFYIT